MDEPFDFARLDDEEIAAELKSQLAPLLEAQTTSDTAPQAISKPVPKKKTVRPPMHEIYPHHPITRLAEIGQMVLAAQAATPEKENTYN